jgi:hypothetical protein
MPPPAVHTPKARPLLPSRCARQFDCLESSDSVGFHQRLTHPKAAMKRKSDVQTNETTPAPEPTLPTPGSAPTRNEFTPESLTEWIEKMGWEDTTKSGKTSVLGTDRPSP